MVVVAYVGVFLALWAAAALLLSRLRWFSRRPMLTDRLGPYIDRPWIDDIEAWLRDR